MPNMTPEELREKLLAQIERYEFTDSGEIADDVLQLFTDLCGEVIGPDVGDSIFNALRADQRTRLTKLTGREIR